MELTLLQRIKPWLFLGGAVIVLLIIGFWVYNFFTTGTIDISTNDVSSSITIYRISPNPESVTDGNTGNHYSLRLAAGTYSITAQNDTFAAQQVVTIKALETKKVQLSLHKLAYLEPVSDRGASFMTIDTQSFAFLDRNNNNVYRIDANNAEHLVDVTHNFHTILWANPNYGIAQTADKTLYEINGDSVQPIAIPYSEAASSTYGIGPNGTIYLANGKAVYAGTVAAGFKQIYVAKSDEQQLTIISASNDRALLTEAEGDSKEGYLMIITQDGHTVKTDGEAYNASWSQSGKYVAITSDGPTEVLDTQLKKVVSLPDTNVNTPVWLDDSNLLYAVGNKAWKYDVTSAKAVTVTSVDTGENISQIKPSQDGSYVYISIQGANNTFRLGRVGLKGQPTSDTMVRLAVVLPNVVNQCAMGYNNFTNPTVIVHGPLTSQDDCLIKTQNYLRLYNVNSSKLKILFSGTS